MARFCVIIFIVNVARFEKVSRAQYEKDLKDLLGLAAGSYDDIRLPKRATRGSAGYDFSVPFDLTIEAGSFVKIPTGIRVQILDGYVLHLYPRSSLGFRYQMTLANTTGIIDSDYYEAKNEGHIIVGVVNRGDKDIILKAGDRFVQGIFLAYYTAEEETVEEQRTGGFGSSDAMRP